MISNLWESGLDLHARHMRSIRENPLFGMNSAKAKTLCGIGIDMRRLCRTSTPAELFSTPAELLPTPAELLSTPAELLSTAAELSCRGRAVHPRSGAIISSLRSAGVFKYRCW